MNLKLENNKNHGLLLLLMSLNAMLLQLHCMTINRVQRTWTWYRAHQAWSYQVPGWCSPSVTPGRLAQSRHPIRRSQNDTGRIPGATALPSLSRTQLQQLPCQCDFRAPRCLPPRSWRRSFAREGQTTPWMGVEKHRHSMWQKVPRSSHRVGFEAHETSC